MQCFCKRIIGNILTWLSYRSSTNATMWVTRAAASFHKSLFQQHQCQSNCFCRSIDHSSLPCFLANANTSNLCLMVILVTPLPILRDHSSCF
jgi:hypothetical protein